MLAVATERRVHAPDKALDAALVKNLQERVQQVVLEEEHFGLEYQRGLRFVGDAARVRVHEYVAACVAAGRPPLDAQLVRAKNARLEQDEKRERVAAYALTRVQAGRKPLREPLAREAPTASRWSRPPSLVSTHRGERR